MTDTTNHAADPKPAAEPAVGTPHEYFRAAWALANAVGNMAVCREDLHREGNKTPVLNRAIDLADEARAILAQAYSEKTL